MKIYAKLQSSRVRHQYGLFGGKSQTSFLGNATRAGSEEGRLFSQASSSDQKLRKKDLTWLLSNLLHNPFSLGIDSEGL